MLILLLVTTIVSTFGVVGELNLPNFKNKYVGNLISLVWLMMGFGEHNPRPVHFRPVISWTQQLMLLF